MVDAEPLLCRVLGAMVHGWEVLESGWAMGEMQENFQHKLRSMRNLCCVVCSERWYTDGKCLDPVLYV